MRFLYGTITISFIFTLVLFFFLSKNSSMSFAYTTNMSASIVLGQSNFTSNNSGLSSSAFNQPRGVAYDGRRLYVADFSNNRILIWNAIPTSNNVPADLVLGQPDFTSNTANNGGISAATLNNPTRVFSDGVKLYVADRGNNRILIWNSLPTANYQAASIVVGQPDFTTSSTGLTTNKFNGPNDVLASNGKLIVADTSNRRAVIFNTIPTSNGTSADVVIGQSSFTQNTPGTSATRNLGFRGIAVSGNKLLLSDYSNSRVLVYNSIPTTNDAAADFVLGQSIMSGGTADNGGISCSTMNFPDGASVSDNGQRYILHEMHRILIWNSIPTTTQQSADIILGQPDCATRTQNYGGISGSSINSTDGNVLEINNKIIVPDKGNNRVLIFDNIVKNPNISLYSSAEVQPNGKQRLTGTASLDSLYTIKSVQFSVNGGALELATPTDGSFNQLSEGYKLDFDPRANNNQNEGYTLKIIAANSNLDTNDIAFLFSPFKIKSPENNSNTPNSNPTFDFSVNTQRIVMRDSLSKYQVQIKRAGSNEWKTYIDNIPVDFRSVKGNSDNLQHDEYKNKDVDEGIYETAALKVMYGQQSSYITVSAKDTNGKNFEEGGSKLNGAYDWRVAAVSRSGNTQFTETRTLRINTTAYIASSSHWFPLALLNLSGAGDVNIFSTRPTTTHYTIFSTTPTFYGIAVVNAKVTATLIEKGCDTTKNPSCTKTYTTITNPQSRFGINIPKGPLQYGKTYATNLSAALDNDYVELPTFSLSVTSE